MDHPALYADQIGTEPCPLNPRSYQSSAVDSVFRQWSTGHRSTLVQMATGLGKSATGALIARCFPEHRGRVLVLANRDELIRQWEATMSFVCNNDQVEVEQGDRRATRNRRSLRRDAEGKRRAFARIVVASKDTMWRDRRLTSFDKDEFGLIVIDECSAWSDETPSWHNIMQYFESASVVGFDATPQRSDGKAMGRVFDSVACEYGMMDAVGDGWLVEPVQQYITVSGYDLSSLSNVRGKDWSEKEIDRMLRQEKPLQAMAQQTVEFAVFEGAKKRPGHILSTLIFNASVDLARLMADILNRRHARDGTGRAAVISTRDTDADERRKILSDFEEGRIKYLSNFGILGRGYDNPNIEMLVLGRPTKFVPLMCQFIGRSSRPLREITDALNAAPSREHRRAVIAASAKPTALILDPIGETGVHSLSIDLADILGGDYGECGAAVVREAKSRAMQTDGKITKEELEEAKKRVDVAEKAELERRKNFIVESSYTSTYVDPWAQSQGGTVASEPKKRRAADDVPTVAQVAFLKKQYKSIAAKEKDAAAKIDKMTQGEAGRMVGEIKRRWKMKLASLAQVRVMVEHGIPKNRADVMSRADADRTIDTIQKNGWRPVENGDAFEG
jgi:superfamily II DNA or RNA helicase